MSKQIFRLNIRKNASISVGVMVVTTLLLFVFILISLNNSASKISGNFQSVSQLNEIYSVQQGYENTLHFRLVEIFLNSYQETLNENSLKIGDGTNIKLNEIFISKIKEKYKKVDKGTHKELTVLFDSASLSILNGNKVFVTLSPWIVDKNLTFSEVNGSRIRYSSVLNSSVSFDMLDLPSFDYIETHYLECVEMNNEELIKQCFIEAFPGFDIDSTKLKSGNLILISKDKYYLNKKMDKISFSLVFDYAGKTNL